MTPVPRRVPAVPCGLSPTARHGRWDAVVLHQVRVRYQVWVWYRLWYPVLLCKPNHVHRLVVLVLRRARTFGPHGRGAVVRHRREDAGVVADVGVGLPADVAVVGVKGGGAGDEIGTNWKERAVSAAGRHPDPTGIPGTRR